MHSVADMKKNVFITLQPSENHLHAQAVELDGAYVMGRWLDVSLATSPESNNVRQTDEIPRNQPFAEEPKEGIIMLIRGLPFDLTNEEVCVGCDGGIRFNLCL